MGRVLPQLTLTALGVAALLGRPDPALAGVYRCVAPGGDVYYADVACPAGFAKTELDIPVHQPNAGPANAADNPYSVLNQARMIEQREERQRERAAARALERQQEADTAKTQAQLQEALALARDAQARALNAEAAAARSAFRPEWEWERGAQRHRHPPPPPPERASPPLGLELPLPLPPLSVVPPPRPH